MKAKRSLGSAEIVVAVSSLALGIALGCGDSAKSAPTMSQVVGPEGAFIQVTKDFDPDIGGTSLFIPANAVSKPTTITITKTATIATAGQTSVGPAVRIGPDGLLLTKAASLKLPFTPSKQPQGSVIAVAVASGANRGAIAGKAIDIDRTAGTVAADIAHFSDYEVVAGYNLMSKCTLDADCEPGQKCFTGTCGTLNSGDMGGGDGGVDGGTDASMQCLFDIDCPKPQRCINGFCS